jgi:MFS family permease
LITQATPREEQGVVLGLTQSLNSVSMIIAPPLGGFLIERGWLTAWGLAASAVAVIGLMLASGSSEEQQTNSSPVNAAAR